MRPSDNVDYVHVLKLDVLFDYVTFILSIAIDKLRVLDRLRCRKSVSSRNIECCPQTLWQKFFSVPGV